MENWLREEIKAAVALQAQMLDGEYGLALVRMCDVVLECFARGGKILTMGNGGSATDALHLAEELIGRYRASRRPLPAICLAADPTALTCIANDFGFENIFARPIEALCNPGDVVIGFSTSGNAANVVAGLRAGRERGGRTIGLLGGDGGRAAEFCDVALIVPHTSTARIQEIHTMALHLICEAVERRYA